MVSVEARVMSLLLIMEENLLSSCLAMAAFRLPCPIMQEHLLLLSEQLACHLRGTTKT